jgi:hypothetical protein
VKLFDHYTIAELKDAGEAQVTLRKAWLSEEKESQKQ